MECKNALIWEIAGLRWMLESICHRNPEDEVAQQALRVTKRLLNELLKEE